MSRWLKLLIGLAATLLAGWIWHAPMGNGERLVSRLEAEAKAKVAETDLPGIEVRMGRDPLSRAATLSGPADQFQREGQGEFQGIDDRVGGVKGISGISWTDDQRPQGRVAPLLLELLGAMIAAFLIGLGIARFLFGREKKESYL